MAFNYNIDSLNELFKKVYYTPPYVNTPLYKLLESI
jgi:hypothetical protein